MTQTPDHVDTRDAEVLGLLSGEKYKDKEMTVPMKTMAYVGVDPKVRANMRASNRWDYLSEYAGYWIDNKRFTIFSVALLVAGFLLLNVFAPVALLMIILGAKYRNVAWMDNFIYSKFGRYRTLVLVD
ncbi:MAG: hypothetical protein V1787_02355 [Candidatus Micrarchaeota archaeon]